MIKPMNPKAKVQWITALRSDEYEQGNYVLSAGRGTEGATHCCLGVLTEVYHEATVTISDPNDWHRGHPTEYITDWAGLDERVMATLINMNDNQGKTFLEIADYIEVEL